MRRQIDLNSHINQNVFAGNPADFPVELRPLFHDGDEGHKPIPSRRAIVRQDTGQAIAVVSNRYTLVPHNRILEVVDRAIEPLDVGPVPRGIYVDGLGARMRAIYKFPTLAQPILGRDEICPCLQVRNTYDGTSRIALHIGAFRFVCTNLAVGGGGAFAGGFVSIHAGEIPIDSMAERLADYLTRFGQIVTLYRKWAEQVPERDAVAAVVKQALTGRFEKFRGELLASTHNTVFDLYNRLTQFATHKMRSARTAFDMLERVNSSFQKTFPVSGVEIIDVTAEPMEVTA